MALTEKDIDSITSTLAKVIADFYKPLAARVAELESRSFLHEAGTWQPNKSYGAGAVVTDHGSAWVARQPTMQRPGQGNNEWRLLVKKGRDGRDAR